MTRATSFNAEAVSAAARALHSRLASARPTAFGLIDEVKGGFIVARVPGAVLGHQCELVDPHVGLLAHAEIISIIGDRCVLAPVEMPRGLSRRVEVVSLGRVPETVISSQSQGCVVDWCGNIISRFADAELGGLSVKRGLRARLQSDLTTKPVISPFATGVKAIDALLTVGEGQRIGVFGAAGTGKSSLVDIVLGGSAADVIVLALIGERRREVAELEERLRHSHNRSRTVVYAATSDRSAAERLYAVQAATSCAEAWRDNGKKVLLIVDSITRIARAMREIGLARGEIPTRRGFPVSVFEELPLLFERAGRQEVGSITAIYTVLVEGEITEDPVAEETMSLIDGHVILSRDIASRGIYPAIDIRRSLSRSMDSIIQERHKLAAREFRALLAAFDDVETLLRMGEYRAGSDPLADKAIALRELMKSFVVQRPSQIARFEESVQMLSEMVQ